MVDYPDGSAGAPAGTPQFASLLSAYPTRPEWQVAAVDYHVGTPANQVLKDPSGISLPGVSVDTAHKVVNVSGDNVTLDGYDFSSGGGWQVFLESGASDLTVKNSYFKVGANNLIPVQAAYGGYVNLLNNTFDGGGSSRSENALFFAGDGATIEYNRFTNFPNDAIDITNGGDFTIKYNAFDTMNLRTQYHTDAIQTYFSAIDSLDVEFNTMYQPSDTGGYNAFVRIGDERGNAVEGVNLGYNTIVTEDSDTYAGANVFQIGAGDGVSGSDVVNPVIHDNFIDPSGILYAVVSPELSTTTNPNVYGNRNLTGDPSPALLVGFQNSWASGMPAAPPATPTILADQAGSGGQHTLSGIAPASTTVDVFDGDTLLGTTQAKSNGTWSLASTGLSAGAHAFTANATDRYGNTSARSAIYGSSSPVPGGGTDNGGSSGPPPASATQTLFPGGGTPALTVDADPNPVELGVRFSTATDGAVTGVQYYKSPADVGTHTATLFDSHGAVLATGTATNETASGWQTMTFASPVDITAGETYVAAFHSNGHYATSNTDFSQPLVTGALETPAAAGVYSYGRSGAFPTHTYEDSNYLVSPVFAPDTAAA